MRTSPIAVALVSFVPLVSGFSSTLPGTANRFQAVGAVNSHASDDESSVTLVAKAAKAGASFLVGLGLATQMVLASPMPMIDDGMSCRPMQVQVTSLQSSMPSSSSLSSGFLLAGGGFETLDFSMPSYSDSVTTSEKPKLAAPTFASPFSDIETPKPAEEKKPVEVVKEAEKVTEKLDAKAEAAKKRAEAVAARKEREAVLKEETKDEPAETKSAPSLPEMKVPDVKLPSFSPPEVKVPEMKVPDVKIPSIPKPDIKMPDVKIPSIPKPDFKVPDVKIPSIPKADIKVPEFSSDFKVPDVKVPEFSSDFKVPDVKVPAVTLPKVDVPDVKLPAMPKTDFKLPAVNLPKLDVPDVKLPDMPKATSDAPSFSVPSFGSSTTPSTEEAEDIEPQEVRDERAREARTTFNSLDEGAKAIEKQAKEARKTANAAKKEAQLLKGEACKTRWGGKILCLRPFGIGY